MVNNVCLSAHNLVMNNNIIESYGPVFNKIRMERHAFWRPLYLGSFQLPAIHLCEVGTPPAQFGVTALNVESRCFKS
jgi:hypothetical protein